MLKSVPWKKGVNTAFEKNIKVMTKMLTSNSSNFGFPFIKQPHKFVYKNFYV